MHIATKMNEKKKKKTTGKTNLIKNLDVVVIEK